jgi:hypothetical protein
MVEETHTPAGTPENPSVRYEPTDASFRWIMGIVLGAIVFAALMQLAITGFFRMSRAHQDSMKASHFPLAATPSTSMPPEPRLEQLNRLEGLGSHPDAKAANESELHSFGPSERPGYVRIPIERAVDLIPERLPVRKDQPSDDQLRHQNGLVGNGGESNSGRMFRGKKP